MMMPKWLFFFATIGFHFNIRRTKATDVKIWRMNMNFNNPRNWEGGRLPCSKDKVIFPSSTPVAIFMPETLLVSEMILPLNGELIFPEKGVFSLTGESQIGSCIGQDIKFKSNQDFWYDPSNWNITSIRAFPRMSSRRNAAVPHAYQVPCATDIVQFPTRTSFKVHGINPTTSVASLHINDVQYNQEEFESLLSTSTGKLLFPDNPRLQITHSACTDETGCVCGNEENSILNTICSFVTPCPEVSCKDPVQVAGHCCSLCAAKIVVQRDDHFRMEKFLQLHQSFHDKPIFRGVESFTSKTIKDEIQSIFVDDTGGNKVANAMAQLVYKALKEDADGARIYGTHSIEISKSIIWNPGMPGYESYSSGMSSGGIAAIIIVLIISSGFAGAIYFYRKRQISGFSFARFDLRSDRIELELGTTPHDELEPGDNPDPPSAAPEEKSKGFDNPIYGTDVSAEESTHVNSLPEDSDFVENPMFMIFEDAPEKDET